MSGMGVIGPGAERPDVAGTHVARVAEDVVGLVATLDAQGDFAGDGNGVSLAAGAEEGGKVFV